MVTKNALTAQRASQQAVIDEMDAELKKVYRQVNRLFAKVQRDGMLAAWDVGALVKSVTNNERKYGTSAVEQLATALGTNFTAQKLLAYRQIANAFTRVRVEKLTTMRTEGGNRITITHLTILAGLNAEHIRDYTKQVFREDLSTDALAAAIQAKLGKRSNSSGRPPSPPKTIGSGLSQIAKYHTEIDKRMKIWEKHVFRRIGESSSDVLTEPLLAKIRETGQEVMALVADGKTLLSQLAAAEQRTQEVVSAGGGNGQPAPPPAQKSSQKASAKKKTTKKKKTTNKVSAQSRAAAAVRKTKKKKKKKRRSPSRA